MSSVSPAAALLADDDVRVAAPRDGAGEMRAKPARLLCDIGQLLKGARSVMTTRYGVRLHSIDPWTAGLPESPETSEELRTDRVRPSSLPAW
jgi:hypothetical protein